MPNEAIGINDGIDTGEGIRKDTNKVTEQDIKRAQSDSTQAKKVQEKIKKTKIVNNNIADFLSFLLKNIKNDQLISAIYSTFFKVIDHRTKTSYLRKSINNIVVIGFFAPFFTKELKQFKLMTYFEDLYNLNEKNLSFSKYILYIKKLSRKYHDNIPIDQDNLLNLIALIMGEFGILKEALNEQGKEKIKKELLKKEK